MADDDFEHPTHEGGSYQRAIFLCMIHDKMLTFATVFFIHPLKHLKS